MVRSTQASVDGAETAGELCRVSSSFLLSSAAGAQAATRDEARGEDCTLHSALKKQRVVVRREKEERESVGGSDGVEKNAKPFRPGLRVPVGLVPLSNGV